MQTLRRLKTTRALTLGLTVAAVLGAAGTSAVAADPEYTGWFVALDAAMTQPTSLDQQYATALSLPGGTQEFLVLDNDAGLSWGGKIGYSWGGLGSLALAYWTFDNDDDLSAVDDARLIYPTVFGGYAYNNAGTYGLGAGGNFPVIYDVTSSVKADTVDLEYVRPMQAGERLTINWIAGLRSVTYEEDLAFSGSDSFPYYYVQTKHIESEGYGIKLGAVFDFGFGEHFALQGAMAFSFLQGNTEATTTQDANGFLDSLTVKNDNVRGEIRDYDLRAVWSWKSVDFYVGYGGQTWDGLVKDPTGDMVNFPVTKADTNDRDSIGFNSAHAGVVFRLGGP
jgi:major outer membrane protein